MSHDQEMYEALQLAYTLLLCLYATSGEEFNEADLNKIKSALNKANSNQLKTHAI